MPPDRPVVPVVHDALVLAGGRARRLGGASKPDVMLAGRRLIDRTLEAAAHARLVVVVGPREVAPAGVLVTQEDPPGGGPVAGVAAGLLALGDGAPLVLVLACDVPRAAAAVGSLVTALGEHDPVDGAVVVDAGGRLQPLVGLYRRDSLVAALAALEASGGVRGVPVHRLLDGLVLTRVADVAGAALDVDTWSDLERAERTLSPPP